LIYTNHGYKQVQYGSEGGDFTQISPLEQGLFFYKNNELRAVRAISHAMPAAQLDRPVAAS